MVENAGTVTAAAVTLSVAVFERTAALLALIEVDPAASALAVPVLLIVAIAVLLEFQVTVLEILAVVLSE